MWVSQVLYKNHRGISFNPKPTYNQTKYLTYISTDAACKLDILALDGDPLSVDGA
jgi:hypothetical protein